MGCTEGLARILVFVANFCFLLIGLALLVVGILFQIDFHKFTDAVPSDYQALEYVPIISIIVGAVIFIIAFLGCCGALKSNTCMLTTYGAILFIIFLLQIGLGIFALVTINDTTDLQNKIITSIETLFGKYYNTPQSSKEVVDLIQSTFKCCGTSSRLSWLPNLIPASCPTNPDAPGCQSKVYDIILGSVKLIGIIALAVSVIEVVGAILALCLANCIKGRKRQGTYY